MSPARPWRQPCECRRAFLRVEHHDARVDTALGSAFQPDLRLHASVGAAGCRIALFRECHAGRGLQRLTLCFRAWPQHPVAWFVRRSRCTVIEAGGVSFARQFGQEYLPPYCCSRGQSRQSAAHVRQRVDKPGMPLNSSCRCLPVGRSENRLGDAGACGGGGAGATASHDLAAGAGAGVFDDRAA